MKLNFLLLLIIGASFTSCDTMKAMQNNRQAIECSTQAICENIQAIQDANRAIEENKRQLDAINETLKGAAGS
jgi:hypothetical protein